MFGEFVLGENQPPSPRLEGDDERDIRGGLMGAALPLRLAQQCRWIAGRVFCVFLTLRHVPAMVMGCPLN